MKLRLFALVTALFILLSGCGSDKSAGQVIRYDIPSGITNLDPQFATDETARMIISNTFEGLFRQLPSGESVPALAQSYDVSPDGLVFTFHLRNDAKWTNDDPVTAHDFAFALTRLFDKTAFSPFASNLSGIQNASLILSGAAPQSSLGVKALSDTTLEITLTQPDSLLPELLSASYAMPCNQEFFESTRARYGLELKKLLANGPFYVRTWNNEKLISLRQNKHYVSPDPTIAAGADLYIPSKASTESKASSSASSSSGSSSSDSSPKPAPKFDPLARFLDGTTDACKVDYPTLPSVLENGGSYTSFEDTIWVLVLNQKQEEFANSDIRKAIAYTVDRNLFGTYLPANLRPTATLIPPVVASMGHSFRTFAGDSSPIVYSPELAKQHYAAGLGELDVGALPFDEILVCSSNSHPLLAGFVQRNLQQNLSLSTGLRALPKDELLARVYAGDYQAAIIPVSAAYSSPDAIFSHFKSNSGQNFSGYKNESFDALLASTATLDSHEQYAAYKQAEQALLADCAAIPLFYETSYYAMRKGVSDIAFSPFLSGVYFKNARKE
ncbi:peptide ABC transporter substrate-binding protein [Oscillospiraceae bacterium PP1C4]